MNNKINRRGRAMFWIIWFGLAVVVGIGAGNRGRSGVGWFVLACIISPLIAGIALLLVGNASLEVTPSSETRTCPQCAEPILKAARKCKHCGSEVEPVEVTEIAS